MGGRPSKGDRDVMVTRPPALVGRAIRRLADERGISISEYIAAVLSDHVGRPELMPMPPAPSRSESELPLTD